MNCASLELCKELFALSGWETADFEYPTVHSPERTYPYFRPFNGLGPMCGDTPAYTLDYLLRELPETIWTDTKDMYDLAMMERYLFVYVNYDSDDYGSFYPGLLRGSLESRIPEDAACKLAIELFRQGILKREGSQS